METLLNIWHNMSSLSQTIMAIVIIVMFVLFLIEIRSRRWTTPKDFKSVIVSIGVLGTFVGIAIGLLNFDSNNITNSVPGLLDGLKTAFFTSILGMFLAIVLSIISKFVGTGDAEDEMAVLVNIEKKLNDLKSIEEKLLPLETVEKHLQTLPLINTKLDSVDTNTKKLSEDISSVKAELKDNQGKLFDFLQNKLKTIDNSLKEAVQTLSEGATEEIIKALEGVIQDFNNNLTEQFGDNFKQLNEAVLNMIDWQKEYKDSVQKFEEQLKLTVENVNTSHQNTTNLIEVFAEDIGKSLSDNREQNQAFNELAEKQLESLLSQTETALSTMQENVKQIESITANYQIIGEVSKNLEQVIATNQNQIQNIETHLQTLTELGNNAQKFTEQTSEFMTGLKNQLQEYTTNIEEQLPKSLDRLNEALTSLTRQFSEDYKTFLNTLNQLTGNRSGSGTPSNQNRNRQIDTS